jgi:GTP-binding protein
MPKPLIALVGRPNVGKSTLFNRLMARPVSVVEDEPGTTRDIVYGDFYWGEFGFTLVDTGGIESIPSSDLATSIRGQAEEAINAADVVFFLVDAKEGITSADEDVAQILRRSRRPVIVVPNKADNETRADTAAEFYALGIEPVIPVSAFHNTGIGELMAEVIRLSPNILDEPKPEGANPLKVAIIGRPNVGKSSLLNTLVGFERAIVHPTPGTTRDALDMAIDHNGQPFLLIDTAGIRRRGRIEQGVEQHSVLRTIRAISRCEVALVLVDGSEGITGQDVHILGYAQQAGKAMVLLVNKMDLAPGKRNNLEQDVRSALSFAPYVPVLFISAKTGDGIELVLDTARRVGEARAVRVTDRQLSLLANRAIESHPPPARGGRTMRLLHITQARDEAPTFVLFVNDPALVHFSYSRYLENQLRERLGYEGTPIKLVLRGRAPRDKEERQ